MSPWELLAVALAGVGAGFINSVAGSGTLLTFPTLLALGVNPVTANVSNNIGLVPGAVSAAWGWRHELVGQRARLLRLASAAVTGGLVGAVLLLVLPEDSFAAVVPVLVLLGRRAGGGAAVGQPPARRPGRRSRGRARTPDGCGRPSASPRSTAATSVPPKGSC